MSSRAGRWRIETGRGIALTRIEVTVDDVDIDEAPVPGESPAARRLLLERTWGGGQLDLAERGPVLVGSTEAAEVVACGAAHDGVCVVGRRRLGTSESGGLSPSVLVSSYEVAEQVPAGSSGLWLRTGALVGIRARTEEVTSVWKAEGLTGELSLETQVVATPEPAELAASIEAMQGIQDLDEHGIEISVLGLGEASVAGLRGETLRYRMRAPDGDIYGAIWSFAGTPNSISEPYARLELETPAFESTIAEAFWTELLQGIHREPRTTVVSDLDALPLVGWLSAGSRSVGSCRPWGRGPRCSGGPAALHPQRDIHGPELRAAPASPAGQAGRLGAARAPARPAARGTRTRPT